MLGVCATLIQVGPKKQEIMPSESWIVCGKWQVDKGVDLDCLVPPPLTAAHFQMATRVTVPACLGAVGVEVTGRREGTEKGGSGSEQALT